MPVVRLPDRLYKRLEAHAKGFDTPTNVIERLLNEYEGVQGGASKEIKIEDVSKPILVFLPDEGSFKEKLLLTKKAKRVVYYEDGSTEEKYWAASRFSSDSNLRANIWSGPLRGWREQGIIKAEFSIDD